MIQMLVSDIKRTDTDMLVRISKDLVARMSEDKMVVRCLRAGDSLDTAVCGMDIMDVALIDVTVPDQLVCASGLRSRFPEVEIVIVADASISPVCYLNPSIRPAALLLKPLNEDVVSSTLTGVYRPLFQQKNDDTDSFYIVEKKGENLKLPYRAIQYFEARSKQVFARTDNVEYGIYDTMDHLMEKLPDTFFRCHRSYIVNLERIIKVRYSENCIVLEGDMTVPLSRTFKQEMKEVMKNYG